jgi:hypothetical protein
MSIGSDRRPEFVCCYTRTCGCLLATLKPSQMLPIPLIPPNFSTQSPQNIPNSSQPPIRSRPLPYRHHDGRRNKYLCICLTIHSHEAVRTAQRVDPTSSRSSHPVLLRPVQEAEESEAHGYEERQLGWSLLQWLLLWEDGINGVRARAYRDSST